MIAQAWDGNSRSPLGRPQQESERWAEVEVEGGMDHLLEKQRRKEIVTCEKLTFSLLSCWS